MMSSTTVLVKNTERTVDVLTVVDYLDVTVDKLYVSLSCSYTVE